ncbi:uncharacterized protein LOC115231760 [Argonauta hians]
MAHTIGRESERYTSIDYTPPTPPLTPQKHKYCYNNNNNNNQVSSTLRNPTEEFKMRRSPTTDPPPRPSSSSSSSGPDGMMAQSADTIIAKVFSAAPPTTLVPPFRDLIPQDFEMLPGGTSSPYDDLMDEGLEEQEAKTFKLQDPPKRKARGHTKSRDDSHDEFDSSSLKPTTQDPVPASPSRAKGQMSITQFMIRPPPQYGSRYRTKSCHSPSLYSPSPNLAPSPCTPSKLVRGNDGGNHFFSDFSSGELNEFRFPPTSPYPKAYHTPTKSPLFSPYKSHRKRSIDRSSVNDKDIVDDFTDLNMTASSPSPIGGVDKLTMRARCRSSQDESDYCGNLAIKSPTGVTPPSPRLVKNICDRRQKHKEAPTVFTEGYGRTPCTCHEDCATSASYGNHGGYGKPTDLVEGDTRLHPGERTLYRGHKGTQEPCQQSFEQQQQRSCSKNQFRHSVSGLLPLDYIHDPEHPLPEEFPYESTFVPSYDKSGVYRKDEVYNRIQPLNEEQAEEPGKMVYRRRWSNKDAIRSRTCDNQLWDPDMLPPSPSHNEAAGRLTPASTTPSSHHPAHYTHAERCHERNSQTPPDVRYEDCPSGTGRSVSPSSSSSSSSRQREYLSTHHSVTPPPPPPPSAAMRRKQPFPSNGSPHGFPPAAAQSPHHHPSVVVGAGHATTPIKSPTPPSPHSHQSPYRMPYSRRGTPTSSSPSPAAAAAPVVPSYGWTSGEPPPPPPPPQCHQSRVYDYAEHQHNGMARRRLFYRQTEETEPNGTSGESNRCYHHHYHDDHHLVYPESSTSSPSPTSGQHRRSHYDSNADPHFTFSSKFSSPPPPPSHKVHPAAATSATPSPTAISPCSCCTGRCSASPHPNRRCCIQPYHSTPPATYSPHDDSYSK